MTWELTRGINDLEKVVLAHPSGSTAEVYLNGAQVTSWKTADGREQLFLSRAAQFEEGRAIRGGIPVVFPQFADSGPLMKHGWLRTTVWGVDPACDASSDSVTLITRDTAVTREQWNFPYEVRLSASLRTSSLEVSLAVANTGSARMSFTAALHTYLAVSDVSSTSILGLYGSPYINKTAGRQVTVDGEQALRITAETDRIYTGAPSLLELSDGARRLKVSESGFSDVVVWNPWAEIARGIKDMRPDDYLRFVCVEAAIADVPHVLQQGEMWSGTQKLVASS